MGEATAATEGDQAVAEVDGIDFLDAADIVDLRSLSSNEIPDNAKSMCCLT